MEKMKCGGKINKSQRRWVGVSTATIHTQGGKKDKMLRLPNSRRNSITTRRCQRDTHEQGTQNQNKPPRPALKCTRCAPLLMAYSFTSFHPRACTRKLYFHLEDNTGIYTNVAEWCPIGKTKGSSQRVTPDKHAEDKLTG
uniref:Uncharacterized protein n=1 Tax=Trypanosoma congolense (strain IL3000) TaxID=1068625 RepID=F9W6X9_TRYCI|nr:hypothetical protein, unlikely [Trypanosoma congolense IL3000]